MARSIITCCLIAVIVPTLVKSLSVLGPKILRPYNPYRVAISGGPRAQSLYVAIEGRRSNGEQFQQGREVQVQAANSRLIDLVIDDPGPGYYTLVARSTSGPQFASSATVVYQPRSFCVFIQTDKRVYQPKDVISFSVIALDKYLLPLDGGVDVSVLDARGAPVRQWAAVPLSRGLFTAVLQLADEPALGQWTIQVESRGQIYSRQIRVADYVMPKFHMDIEMPKEILFKDGRFTVNVTAKHFNGLPVRGELTLSAYAVFFSGVLQPIFSTPSRKVIDFNGQSEVTYDLKTDLDLAEDAARPLVIEAVLEEKDTLIRQNVTGRILLLRTPYRLKITAPEHFKPELPYNVQIEVVNSSGHLIEEDSQVTIDRLWDDGAPVNVTNLPLIKGMATYTLIPDKAHGESRLNLVVKYKEVSERLINIKTSTASGKQFLTIELLSQGSTAAGEMRARITATEPMDLINYAVSARGDLHIVKTLELSPSRHSVDISIPVTNMMAPGFVLLAWYPRLDPIVNIIVSSALYVPHTNLLQYQISVQVPTGSRPGFPVDIRVSGETGAHAVILAEDSRAIAAGLAGRDGLGDGLDLHTIEREVESFNGLRHSVFKNDDHQPRKGLDLGGLTTADVFNNAGVVMLTDGVVGGPQRAEQSSESPESGTRPPLAGPYAFSRLPPPPAPRYYLTTVPEPTWMLTNFTLENEDKRLRAPTSANEWTIGAFAVHPTLGLGLASPKTFTTSLPLSITAQLPASLQKGETIAAVVTLTSTLTVATSVEVTFHNSEQYFEFEPLENNVDSAKKIELFRRLRVTVPATGSVSTAFLVTVVRNGEAPVIVEASGNGVSASLFKTIDVKDGYEENLWTWVLLDGRRGVARSNISLEANAGTKLGVVSLLVGGDLLAPALRDFRAAPAPAADPLHALRPLATAAVLLDYLKMTERDEVSLTAEARAQAAEGYQRLMAYRKQDGSFAPEINDDVEGDVFMTATACRWLSQSARYVEVSPTGAAAAARWLVEQQGDDGSWTPPPPAARLHPRAQAPLPLTAHALMALLSVQSSEALHKNAVNKAVDSVARAVSGADVTSLEPQWLAVAGAALSAARHPLAARALQLLEPYTNATGSARFWGRKLSGSEWRNPWLKMNSAEAETASWGLRAMLTANLVEEALPVARYLLAANRPDDMDPDVLKSLSDLSIQLKLAQQSTMVRVSVNMTGSEEPRQFNIDNDNALIVQTQLVRKGVSGRCRTEGRGLAVAGLAGRGGTNVTAPWPRYTLDPRVDAVSTKDRLQLSICVAFVPQGEETISGSTLLTVQLPSGYLADINTLTELKAASHVSTARLAGDGSRVVAWLRALDSREKCVTVAAPRGWPVARQRPGHVTLLDLYDSSHRARLFFQPIAAHACDVCRSWESCAGACGAAAARRDTDPASPRTLTPSDPSAPAAAAVAAPTALSALLATLALALRYH